eukprot:5278163-Lingulodinium_polyedra.AAC.1
MVRAGSPPGAAGGRAFGRGRFRGLALWRGPVPRRGGAKLQRQPGARRELPRAGFPAATERADLARAGCPGPRLRA